MRMIIGVLIVIGVLAGMPVIASAALDEENIALASNGASVIGGSPINDGVVSGYTGSTGFSWFYWPDSMTIVLPKIYTVDRIKTLLWDGDGRYHQYYLEVSEDGEKWTKVVDKTSGQWKSWQLDTFESIPAKYIRITGTYGSANEGFAIVELEAYEKNNDKNVALASNGASVIGGSPINDGVVSGYTGSTGFSWFYWPDSMTIVLPKIYTVDRIKTLLWDGDSRYHQYYLEVSEDGEKWTKVVDKTSGQWKSWQLDTFEPIPAKYVRITGTYGSANEGFAIVELEVYASIDSNIIDNNLLTVIKLTSLVSIRQFQETTIIISLENSGTSDITDIEVIDSIHPSFEKIDGDFPNPQRFDLIRSGESREIQYTIKAKESGTFTLDPATVTYADVDGNIHEAKSEPASIKVIPSTESSTAGVTSRSNPSVSTASVQLHGEKTNVVLGEDILLKLSAVNLITKPLMHVQVIIIPPSGMSVTSSAFAKSGAGQYTTTYELESGTGKDIEVAIRSNQVGDFDVNGRIIYYFGDDREDAEDHTLILPITVRAEPGAERIAGTSESEGASTPGFAAVFAVIGLLLAYMRRKA